MTTSPDLKSIKGKIVWVDLEGGFWGVIDDEGNKYVPTEPLDPTFLKDGVQISADVEPVVMFGTTMWGQHARFHTIGLR
jgi:hypothetical protein